jgi:hypothetical protein
MGVMSGHKRTYFHKAGTRSHVTGYIYWDELWLEDTREPSPEEPVVERWCLCGHCDQVVVGQPRFEIPVGSLEGRDSGTHQLREDEEVLSDQLDSDEALG